ncbi:MAG: VanZ family protein [Deltaproteobacteria bacterium]|nr:VanZ family protein [Deltaproteobacteria bacterium]
MNDAMASSLAGQQGRQSTTVAAEDSGPPSGHHRSAGTAPDPMDEDQTRNRKGQWSALRLLMLVLAVAWTAMVVVGTALPPDMVPKTALHIWDKAIHFTLFAGFGFLWLAAMPAKAIWSITVVLAGVSLGMITELYQHYWIPGRSGDPKDFLADCIGVLAAWMLYVLGRFVIRRLTTEKKA